MFKIMCPYCKYKFSLKFNEHEYEEDCKCINDKSTLQYSRLMINTANLWIFLKENKKLKYDIKLDLNINDIINEINNPIQLTIYAYDKDVEEFADPLIEKEFYFDFNILKNSSKFKKYIYNIITYL